VWRPIEETRRSRYGMEQGTIAGFDRSVRDLRLKTPQSSLLLQAIEEFNQGKFIESHESLEKLWKSEHHPIRRLYQGILQISVAFHHLGQHRYQSTVTLLERGSGYLGPFAPDCLGVDISGLITGSARCLAEVRRLGPDRLDEFDWSIAPKLYVAPTMESETDSEGRFKHE
jgi:predicted metal-dependent hydrolase